MCSKEEVEEVVQRVVATALQPILTAQAEEKIQHDNTLSLVAEVKRSFNQLGCRDHNDRILKNEFRHDSVDKEVNYMVKDVYPRLIELEKDNSATKEKGRGMDKEAVKTWGLILAILGFLFMVAKSMFKEGL